MEWSSASTSATVERTAIFPPTCRSNTGSPAKGCASAMTTQTFRQGGTYDGEKAQLDAQGWCAELVGPRGIFPGIQSVTGSEPSWTWPDPCHGDGNHVLVGDRPPVPRVDSLVGVVAEQPPRGRAVARRTPLRRALHHDG